MNTMFAFLTTVSNALRRFNLSSEVRFFIACQFALESDYGKSRLCARNCNYCGMKVPSLRVTNCVNIDSSGFAKYNSFADCIVDYVLWLQYNRVSRACQSNVIQFAEFIKSSGYCPESDYVKRIFDIYDQYVS